MAVFIPMTFPLISARGPPLLPGLIAVSVCISPSKMKSAPGKGLPRALTTPDETRALSFDRHNTVRKVACHSNAVDADYALAKLLDCSSNLALKRCEN